MRILERRFRRRIGEIDLIADDDGAVVFVEVKTRRGDRYGRPAEAVTLPKQGRLARVALAFLQRRDLLDRPTRFDVVEVVLRDDGRAALHHIRDAFRPPPA